MQTSSYLLLWGTRGGTEQELALSQLILLEPAVHDVPFGLDQFNWVSDSLCAVTSFDKVSLAHGYAKS
jgi:hypothetical protein